MQFVVLLKKLLIVAIAALVFIPLTATAQASSNKGLAVSPPRQYIAVDAGGTTKDTIAVANYTEKPLVVDLKVDQFSVTDYVYEYRFYESKQNWLKLEESQVSLKPHEVKKVAFVASPPAGTPPGGVYFTILASASITQNSIATKVQVATPLYITVNGTLSYTNELQSSTVARLVFGKKIPITLNVRNSGNTHYFIYVTAALKGLFTGNSQAATTRLLMPDTTRAVAISVPSPFLPGVYKVVYGYTGDNGNPTTYESYVVYTPPWFYAALLILSWIAYKIFKKRYAKVKKDDTTKDSAE